MRLSFVGGIDLKGNLQHICKQLSQSCIKLLTPNNFKHSFTIKRQSNCCIFHNYKNLTVSYLLSLEKATTTVSHGRNTAETACDYTVNFQHNFHTSIILLGCWIFPRSLPITSLIICCLCLSYKNHYDLNLQNGETLLPRQGSLHMLPFAVKCSSSEKAEQSKDQEGVLRVILTPSYSTSYPKSNMGGMNVSAVIRRYWDTINIQVPSIYLYIHGILFQLKKGHQLSRSINHIRNYRGSGGK